MFNPQKSFRKQIWSFILKGDNFIMIIIKVEFDQNKKLINDEAKRQKQIPAMFNDFWLMDNNLIHRSEPAGKLKKSDTQLTGHGWKRFLQRIIARETERGFDSFQWVLSIIYQGER